jgi:hypothetical protein
VTSLWRNCRTSQHSSGAPRLFEKIKSAPRIPQTRATGQFVAVRKYGWKPFSPASEPQRRRSDFVKFVEFAAECWLPGC